MRFEWSEAKRLVNVRKHGIDFRDVVSIFEGEVLTIEDDRFDNGETHYLSLGLLQGRVILVVHTEQADVIRIISARKATRYESTRYFSELSD